MSFTEEEIDGFKSEAEELLDSAEKSLLAVDKGEPLPQHYDAVFRAFHSIKGAAGMMDMTALQSHMHQLETIFTEQKTKTTLEKPFVDLFLRGLDGTRTLLKGESLNFDYSIGAKVVDLASRTSVVDQKPTAIGKILVIDDELEIVDLLKQILSLEGIDVLGLTDPEQALAAIKTFKPDAVFTDISMPNLSGLDLLALISKSDPDLPIVFISGHVDKDTLLKAIRLGVFGVIEKPFDDFRVVQAGLGAIERHRLSKMVTSSINLLMYQFSDLSEFLKNQGRLDVHKVMSDEIAGLIAKRKSIRSRRILVD